MTGLTGAVVGVCHQIDKKKKEKKKTLEDVDDSEEEESKKVDFGDQVGWIPSFVDANLSRARTKSLSSHHSKLSEAAAMSKQKKKNEKRKKKREKRPERLDSTRSGSREKLAVPRSDSIPYLLVDGGRRARELGS